MSGRGGRRPEPRRGGAPALTARIVRAPAKLNLVLRVGARRPDGYHEVTSLMAALSLADILSVARARRTLVTCAALPGGDTLVTGALALLAEAAGYGEGFRVRIDKRIPVGAGLGGGSADAGTALRAANDLLPQPVPEATLRRIAVEIGSDVPFFLQPVPTIARGRGEDCLPTGRPLPRCVVALASPGSVLPTRDVYAVFRPPAGRPPPAIEHAETLEALAAATANDLEPAAEQLEPACRELREGLLARGALAAHLCGSGSAVYGLFRTDEAAMAALEGLPAARWTSRATLLSA